MEFHPNRRKNARTRITIKEAMSEALGSSNKQRIVQKCFFTFGKIQAYYRDPASRMPFRVKEAIKKRSATRDKKSPEKIVL